MDGLFPFERLKVWQKARIFTKEIYTLTKTFPKEEIYGLTTQLRRASISVASNIAEGNSRKTAKDKAHFTTEAFSSLMEVVNQLIISHNLEYLDETSYFKLRKQAKEMARMLSGLKNYQERDIFTNKP